MSYYKAKEMFEDIHNWINAPDAPGATATDAVFLDLANGLIQLTEAIAADLQSLHSEVKNLHRS